MMAGLEIKIIQYNSSVAEMTVLFDNSKRRLYVFKDVSDYLYNKIRTAISKSNFSFAAKLMRDLKQKS